MTHQETKTNSELDAKVAALLAEYRTNNTTSTKPITPQERAEYGEDLIELAKRAAEEAMGPQVIALRRELLSAMGQNNSSDAAYLRPRNELVTPEYVKDYGGELIDLIKRAAMEAMQPELRALRHELLSATGQSNSNGAVSAQSQSKLITPEEVRDYGSDFVDFIKRAAMEDMRPKLDALRQEILTLVSAMGAAAKTATPTHAASPTNTELAEAAVTWLKNLTTMQKACLAGTIAVVTLLVMFRYDVVPTNKVGVVIQRDRWTGTKEMCVIQADKTFKCGK